MAIYVRKYHQCTPLVTHLGAVATYTGAAVAVTNDSEGIIKVTVTNPKRQQEPLIEHAVVIQPGTTANVPAGLLDRTGAAITTQSEVVLLTDGSTNTEPLIGAAAAITYA